MIQTVTYHRHACTVPGCDWAGPWIDTEDAAAQHYHSHILLAHYPERAHDLYPTERR